MLRVKTLFIKALILVLFVFFTLSIYSYSPYDPGFLVIGSSSPRNWGGILGAYLSSVVFFLLGLVSLVLPPLAVVICYLIKTGFLWHRVLILALSLPIALSMSVALLSQLLEVKDRFILDRYPLHGGIVGELLATLINFTGIPIVLLIILILFLIPPLILIDRGQLSKLFNTFRGLRTYLRSKESPMDEVESRQTEALTISVDEQKVFSLPQGISEGASQKVASEEVKPRNFSSQSLPPPLELLNDPPVSMVRTKPEELKERALLLKAKLREFGIEGEVTGINPGPVITVFEFKPAPGIKLSRILSLVDDLALGLSAKSVRIVAPIPGKNVIGIEISNPQREWVYLKEIINTEAFKSSPSPLTFALGKDIFGNPLVADLKKMPHLLIAGSTGSGKSIFIHSTILSMIYKSAPNDIRFLMIDPKRIELSVYDGIPYLLHPVVLEPKMATGALRWAVQEMERRYALFEELSVRNLESYNEQFEEKLPYIVIIIDELADLMVVASKEVETLLTRLAQMARASGIHLIVATQRPSVDVITGLIKVNFPARISFQVTSKVDSRTILDTQGAERLLGAGDMLFMPPGSSHLLRAHAPFVSENEVKRIVEYLKSLGEPEYLADLSGLQLEEDDEMDTQELSNGDDELYREALKIAYQYGKISTSMLQRKLRIGYNRAARLVERMEEEGIIGPSDGVRPRPVIAPRKPDI